MWPSQNARAWPATIEMESRKREIQTKRLCLRTFEPHDLEPLHRLWNDEEIMRYIRPGWAPPREDVEKYFATIEKRWVDDGFSHFAITLKGHDDLIGYCGFQYLEQTPQIELLYGLAKPHWRQGYITEAANACLRFAYEHTNLDRIIALSNPANKGSWRVMEKIGMKYEMIVSEYKEDLLRYAITRNEFKQSNDEYDFRII